MIGLSLVLLSSSWMSPLTISPPSATTIPGKSPWTVWFTARSMIPRVIRSARVLAVGRSYSLAPFTSPGSTTSPQCQSDQIVIGASKPLLFLGCASDAHAGVCGVAQASLSRNISCLTAAVVIASLRARSSSVLSCWILNSSRSRSSVGAGSDSESTGNVPAAKSVSTPRLRASATRCLKADLFSPRASAALVELPPACFSARSASESCSFVSGCALKR